MRLEHNFDVAVPVERVWAVLGDLETIVPCMPGAALTSHDGDAFTGVVRVRIGPVSLSLKGKGRFTERDEAARRLAFTASGQDSRGAGAANATVSAQLSPTEGGTRVDVVTDLYITGRMAQIGRNMIGDVSGKLLDQFVACLSGKLAGPARAVVVAVTPTEAPQSTPDSAPPGPPAPTTADGAAAPSGAATPAPAEPEAVDLLALSGANSLARRVAPWAIGAVVLVGVIIVIFAVA